MKGAFAIPLVAVSLAVSSPLAGQARARDWASYEPSLAATGYEARFAAETRTLRLPLTTAVRSRAPGTVFMIVGGAVAVAGLIADESLLVVGGVVVGAYGLYLYLG